MRKLLLIAPDISEFAKYIEALQVEGFSLSFEGDPRRVKERIEKESFAGVLISFQNNWYTCFQICDEIKHMSRIPTCVLSAYQDEIDALCSMRKNALYLPISVSPIYAATFMKVLTNEYRQIQMQMEYMQESEIELDKQENAIRIHGVKLIDELHKVYVNGKEVDCAGLSYDALKYLMTKSPAICSYEEIYQHVWRANPCGNYEKNVRVLINKLRKMLDGDEVEASCIETVRKEGYRFT